MEMKRKNVAITFSLLAVLGITVFFSFHANSQTVNFFMETIEFKSPTSHTTPEEYEGPQTVPALMNAFDAAYNQRYSKTTVIVSLKDDGLYRSEFAIRGEIDARYPRVEWLQMLLNRGVTIENFDGYRSYLSKRHTLAFLEDNPNLRKIGVLGIPPTDDWETYKEAYIDKLVKDHAKIRKASKQIELGKKQLERTKKQLERVKKQSNQQHLKHVEAKLENAKEQLEDAKKQLERAQKDIERAKRLTPPRQKSNPEIRKKSPYPPL